MENNTDQKPNDESLQPAEVEGVEVAQAPAAEDETDQTSTEHTPAESEGTYTGSEETTDKKEEAPAASEETPAATPAPLQPVVHKSGAPILAIVAAVVVAIGLAGITVYAYMQTQKDATPPAASQTATDDTSAADSQEIDDTSKEIDEALKASEETDFPDNELSDQNLNL